MSFFNSNFSNYPKANIAMDKYDQSQFFIGEIPTSAYTFTPSSSDVAVVVISRAGGEGGDLSTNLKRDAQTSTAQNTISSNANAALMFLPSSTCALANPLLNPANVVAAAFIVSFCVSFVVTFCNSSNE